MLPVVLGLLLSTKPLPPVERGQATVAPVCVARRERVVERHRKPVARPWARWLARARFSR
jgi:hypothetical protein